jgi:hypothetical protein
VAFDDLEIVLEGGQVQAVHEAADLFGAFRDGGGRPD